MAYPLIPALGSQRQVGLVYRVSSRSARVPGLHRETVSKTTKQPQQQQKKPCLSLLISKVVEQLPGPWQALCHSQWPALEFLAHPSLDRGFSLGLGHAQQTLHHWATASLDVPFGTYYWGLYVILWKYLTQLYFSFDYNIFLLKFLIIMKCIQICIVQG